MITTLILQLCFFKYHYYLLCVTVNWRLINTITCNIVRLGKKQYNMSSIFYFYFYLKSIGTFLYGWLSLLTF